MTEQERNAKIEYLKSYRWIEAEIRDDEERLAHMDARLYGPPCSTVSDMPRGGQAKGLDQLVAERLELKDRINEKCARKREILRAIESMPNERDRRILKLEFIDDLTHEQTAERINYSVMQTRRFYNTALERFQILEHK